jgi:hypothetical protein
VRISTRAGTVKYKVLIIPKQPLAEMLRAFFISTKDKKSIDKVDKTSYNEHIARNNTVTSEVFCKKIKKVVDKYIVICYTT